MPDLNPDPVRAALRAGPQPRNVSERMSKDMSERMPKDMSERMSEDMSERMFKKCVRKNVRKKWGELEVVEDIISMMFSALFFCRKLICVSRSSF